MGLRTALGHTQGHAGRVLSVAEMNALLREAALIILKR